MYNFIRELQDLNDRFIPPSIKMRDPDADIGDEWERPMLDEDDDTVDADYEDGNDDYEEDLDDYEEDLDLESDDEDEFLSEDDEEDED